MRMSCEIVSKALLRSNMPVAAPSFTQPLIWSMKEVRWIWHSLLMTNLWCLLLICFYLLGESLLQIFSRKQNEDGWPKSFTGFLGFLYLNNLKSLGSASFLILGCYCSVHSVHFLLPTFSFILSLDWKDKAKYLFCSKLFIVFPLHHGKYFSIFNDLCISLLFCEVLLPLAL